jgi:hypothetical protein
MVNLCGCIVNKYHITLVDANSQTLRLDQWLRFPADKFYDEITSYCTFRSMVDSLLSSSGDSALSFFRDFFAGWLEPVEVSRKDEDLADFLVAEGVLLRPDVAIRQYHVTSPLVDELLRTVVIPKKFPNGPSTPPPIKGKKLNVLGTLCETLKFFNKNLILLASSCSYKTPKVKITNSFGDQVPRESVYGTELMRILANWLDQQSGWSVTGQWHLQNRLNRHKYSDIVLKEGENQSIVLELVATGDRNFIQSHIDRTPEYMAILSAKEAWIVHFTREDKFDPLWQSEELLAKGVNVVHFWHDRSFQTVLMSAYWKDDTGKIHKVCSHSVAV